MRKDHPLEMLIRPMGVTLPVRSPGKSRVRKVAAGREHTAALTTDGDVFMLGNNSYGQCGRRVIEQEDYLNNRVAHRARGPWTERGEEMEDVYCGQDHRSAEFKTLSKR